MEAFLQEIGKAGPLGAVLALSLLANGFQYVQGQKKEEQIIKQLESRLSDVKEGFGKFAEPMGAIKETVTLMYGIMTSGKARR